MSFNKLEKFQKLWHVQKSILCLHKVTLGVYYARMEPCDEEANGNTRKHAETFPETHIP